jgi:hypothetical protein
MSRARASTEDRAGGVTARAVVVALVMLVVVTLVGFYVEICWLKMYDFAGGVPATAPAVVLFALAALAGSRFLLRSGFTRRELLVIYSVLMVAGPLGTHGILFWMLPKSIVYYYAARAQPTWEHILLPQVPTWFAPTDPHAVENFFEGQSRVPWSLWWTPLGAWSGLLLCIFGATAGLVLLLQRQWIVNERLAFPLAQVPLEVVRSEEGGPNRPAGVPRSPLFWLGTGVVLAVSFMDSLSTRVPTVPAIPLGPTPIMYWQKVGPLAGLGQIDLVLYPWLIALSYLLPGDISFSCWFFWLVRLGLTVLSITIGNTPRLPEEWYDSTFPAPMHQGLGATLALGLWALWIARRHLAHAFRVAVGFGGPGADAEEPLPYRWALIGIAACLCGIVFFCYAAGCRIIVGLAIALLLAGFYLTWARLRAETGLGFMDLPLGIDDALLMGVGGAAYRPRELVTLMSLRWAYAPFEGQSLDITTAGALETMKIAESARINPRRLAGALAIGFVFSLCFGIFVLMNGFYHYGYLGMGFGTQAGSWPAGQTPGDARRLAEMLTNPSLPNMSGVIGVVSGAAVTVLLGLLRLRLWWWPLNPAGYLAANTWDMHWYYMPFFVGWAWKVLTVRYGGLRLYRRTMPLAIGMIMGDLLNRGVWAVVALVTHGRF